MGHESGSNIERLSACRCLPSSWITLSIPVMCAFHDRQFSAAAEAVTKPMTKTRRDVSTRWGMHEVPSGRKRETSSIGGDWGRGVRRRFACSSQRSQVQILPPRHCPRYKCDVSVSADNFCSTTWPVNHVRSTTGRSVLSLGETLPQHPVFPRCTHGPIGRLDGWRNADTLMSTNVHFNVTVQVFGVAF